MLSLKEFEEFMDYAKGGTDEILEYCRDFSDTFPAAEFKDYKNVFKSLVRGDRYEDVVNKYIIYQASLGSDLAKSDMATVLKMEDCIDHMLHDFRNGKERGSSTYIDVLDNAWTWRLGEFNIWTGYTNEGKSLFLRFISLIKAIMDQWRFAFYAPEDYPANEFFDDVIHTAAGRSTDPENPGVIKEGTYKMIYEKIKDYFLFVYIRPPENTLINIFSEFKRLQQTEGIKGAIIDPIIKVNRPHEFMNADDKYAGYVTTLATDFARTTNLSLHLVMHQLTPRLTEAGLYPKPNYYNIKGGGTWVDGTDNVNSIQRPLYAKDKLDNEVLFNSLKIKKQKLVGIPQEIKFRFNRKSNRYIDHATGKDLFEFGRHLDGRQSAIPGCLQ